MKETIWWWIERIVTLWGLLSIVAIGLDAINLLPYYDIYYKKTTDITPAVSMYPGQTIRLSAQFASTVDPKDLESVVWKLRDSAGKEYGDLPHLKEVDVGLLPDFSGLVNIEVKAKLLGDDKQRYGSGSIQVVQSKPYQMSQMKNAAFALPFDWKEVELKTVQIYAGSSHWLPVSQVSSSEKEVYLATDVKSFSVWDGKAFLRYKSADNPTAMYKYEALTALAKESEFAPKVQ